jgi:hypothetical protein
VTHCKFKVGDKVKYIYDQEERHSLSRDRIYTVSRIRQWSTACYVGLADHHFHRVEWWDQSFFEHAVSSEKQIENNDFWDSVSE